MTIPRPAEDHGRTFISGHQFVRGPYPIRGYTLWAEKGRLRIELLRADESIHHAFYVEGTGLKRSGLVIPGQEQVEELGS